MDGAQVQEVFSHLANNFLVWLGFGTLVGLLAKAILPGRDPGGALATVCVGILGALLGVGVLAYFSAELRVAPLSVIGFAVATLGGVLLLVLYRIMSGRIFREGIGGAPRRRYRRRVVVRQD